MEGDPAKYDEGLTLLAFLPFLLGTWFASGIIGHMRINPEFKAKWLPRVFALWCSLLLGFATILTAIHCRSWLIAGSLVLTIPLASRIVIRHQPPLVCCWRCYAPLNFAPWPRKAKSPPPSKCPFCAAQLGQGPKSAIDLLE